MSSGRSSPILHRVTTILPRPSAALLLHRRARTSCATLHRRSTCVCRMKMTSARASSPARSRPTPPISHSVCPVRVTAITQWRTRVISWTGPRSSRWHSTRKRQSGSIIRFRRPSVIPARCAVKCAPCAPQILSLRAKKSNSARKRAHADASEYKRAVGRPLFFAVCLNWACADWRIENVK